MFDSEMKIMEILWEKAPEKLTAKEISVLAEKNIGWNKNTTYTVIKKLVEKGYVKREEPGFLCSALIKKEEVQKNETQGLIKRFFNGSRKALMSSLLADETLSEDELNALRELIRER